MSIRVSEVTNYEDFRNVVDVELNAYANPLNSFVEIYKGPTADETAERQWMFYKMVPGSTWIKATCAETGKIFGAAEWIVHKENPYKEPSGEIKAAWWPEDHPLHEMGNQILATFMGQRPKRMSRPHILLNVCFVGQEYRRRGVGKALVQWGVDLCQKLNLESFIEATESGKPLYEPFGYKTVDCFILDAHTDNPTEAWNKEKARILPQPFRIWFMWRPAGGPFIEGQTKYSWESEAKPQEI